ncbi:MAG: fluoride efflux transporter CrcB [Bacteroidetes bacterium]|nr:MAG: fluoride efflux transporter CrcB [Bacteroidota bacterium]
MNNLGSTLLVALGGATGSVLRYAVGLCLPMHAQRSFPWATLLVNLGGSLLIGLLLGTLAKHPAPAAYWQPLLVTGFCGGFTTLSAFSNDGFLLLRQQHYTMFLLYFAATLVLGIMAAALGYHLSK